MRIKGKGKSILTRQRLPVLGLFEGLLDQVSGAAAAYSIRLLRADYSDGLLRVRAFDGSSDQGEADVLPDSNNEISLSSELTNRDSTAGSSGRDVSTLGELVTNSNGTDYDGFVSEWKDQTPNARHATNSTASEQPQLVDVGQLITENGKPKLKALSGKNKLEIPISTNQQYYLFNVGSLDNTDNGIVGEKGNLNSFIYAARQNNTSTDTIGAASINNARRNGSSYAFGSKTRDDLYNDYLAQTLAYIDFTTNFSGNNFLIGYSSGLAMFSEQEFILYTSKPDIQKVESNQNNFFQAF